LLLDRPPPEIVKFKPSGLPTTVGTVPSAVIWAVADWPANIPNPVKTTIVAVILLSMINLEIAKRARTDRSYSLAFPSVTQTLQINGMRHNWPH
jgi:hypothetical protein